MRIDIGDRYVETDRVNAIVVGGRYCSASNFCSAGKILVCLKDDIKINCFDGARWTIGQLQEVLKTINKLFVDKGVDSFVILRDKFLINIDNVKEVRSSSTSDGLYLVEAEFKDGEVTCVYLGNRKQSARNLINQYKYAEEVYLEKKQREY